MDHDSMVSKVRTEDKPKSGKRKVSEVEDSEDDKAEVASPRKVKSRQVIEDSNGEGDWLQDREHRENRELDNVKVAEEVQGSSASEAKDREEADKGTAKAKAKSARRSERNELMREIILAVRELGLRMK
jgi:hypothetical protein